MKIAMVLLMVVSSFGCGTVSVPRKNENVVIVQVSSPGDLPGIKTGTELRTFTVELFEGWSELSYSYIPEASVAKYANPELNAYMTVSFLTFSGSPMAILAGEIDRLEAKRWEVTVLDDDESDGMVSLAANSKTHGSIVRVMSTKECSKDSPSCAVVFAGLWTRGSFEAASMSCDMIQASFRTIP